MLPPLEQFMICTLQDKTSGKSAEIYSSLKIKKLSDPLDHQKSKRAPEKHLLLLYWLCQSFWRCGSQQTGKFWKRWEYQTTWPAFWEICMQVKKQQLELDMKQQTGSKLGKDYVKDVYCHPAYLNHTQSTSCKMLSWMKHKLESRLPGEISIT